MRIPPDLTASAVMLALLACPAVALGHVELEPKSIPKGEVKRVSLVVENERQDARTAKVDVKLPNELYLLPRRTIRGWSMRTMMQPIRAPVRLPDGERITERVSRLILRARSSNVALGPHETRRFSFTFVALRPPGTTVTVKVLQTYDNGEVVRWIGPPDSEEPAPRLSVKRSSGNVPVATIERAAPAKPPLSRGKNDGSGDDDDGDLPWPALLAAAGGVALLGLSLRAVGRRRRASK